MWFYMRYEERIRALSRRAARQKGILPIVYARNHPNLHCHISLYDSSIPPGHHVVDLFAFGRRKSLVTIEEKPRD